MNVSNLTFESYENRLFTTISSQPLRSIFSIPPIGKIILDKFLQKSTNYYTRILLELTGLVEYIDEIPKSEALILLPKLKKFQSLLTIQESQIIKLSNTDRFSDFQLVISQIILKIDEITERLEDVIHAHHSYSLSVNYSTNDWADAENDHWDNY